MPLADKWTWECNSSAVNLGLSSLLSQQRVPRRMMSMHLWYTEKSSKIPVNSAFRKKTCSTARISRPHEAWAANAQDSK